ncbi:sulfopyruvate decarboxylase subunit beta [Methanosalsum natronophilum]|uniref:sulfopyruvate decarboxylase subunit beta n=1 Tax=Methanosalsum natronophilum TaxID=768733 RepID=UPI0021696432|nr:sulfopyruvate decarboxylase subunit beta [Methanosalsum natronophilum]MCS3923623.1 sulfopyruvate decarboxylase subunit beta [Methanosalsum natronophilum]
MRRIDAIKEIASFAKKENALLISNIGVPSKELYYVSDTPQNFYMLGSMGLVSSIGLGLSLAKPDRKVISIDGDGSILMNLGSLTTIASTQPSNYVLVIIDNGSYGSTGDQPTATSHYSNIATIAKGAGNRRVDEVNEKHELRAALENMSSGILIVKAEPGNANGKVIELTPKQIIGRFMDHISSRPYDLV